MARPGLRDHPKFRRLRAKLRMPDVYVQAHLEEMWRGGYETGNPKLGDAFAVESCAAWHDSGRADNEWFAAVLECGWIDEKDGVYYIHDLHENAPAYVNGRREKEEERQKPKTCNHCGGIYHSPEKHAKFCSSPCRQAGYRHRSLRGVTQPSVTETEASVTVTGCYEPPAPAPSAPVLIGEESPKTPLASSKGSQLTFVPGVDKESDQSPVVMEFPVNGNAKIKEWPLHQSYIDKLSVIFPRVNILQECFNARQWCENKPRERKTAKGMPEFLRGWMERNQNKGGPSVAPTKPIVRGKKEGVS